MNKVGWIIFGAIVVAVLGGLIAYSRLTNPSANVTEAELNSVIAASDTNGNIADHVFGLPESKVVLIEYGDFQCTSCGGAHPQIKDLTEEYKDRITFIFRNLPLTSIHPNARAAAAAVEAAGLQGKYWEMHNLLFESQSEWSSLSTNERTGAFSSYAESLGLDAARFTNDLNSDAVKKKISFDEALFKQTGYEKSTPTFVLNGTQVDAETSGKIVRGDSSALKTLIDTALDK
jgi:protein-disulfide isomerase